MADENACKNGLEISRGHAGHAHGAEDAVRSSRSILGPEPSPVQPRNECCARNETLLARGHLVEERVGERGGQCKHLLEERLQVVQRQALRVDREKSINFVYRSLVGRAWGSAGEVELRDGDGGGALCGTRMGRYYIGLDFYLRPHTATMNTTRVPVWTHGERQGRRKKGTNRRRQTCGGRVGAAPRHESFSACHRIVITL